MKNRWYDKSMPSIGSVSSSLQEVYNSMIKFSGIKDIKVFGSFANNIKNKDYPIKDIDILVFSNFDSGDLLAIDMDSGVFGMSKEDLEFDGYDTKSILFTKYCRSLKGSLFDIWLVSKDKKVLHIGQMPESIEDWKEIRKESEDKTEILCGFSRQDLYKKSNKERELWKNTYDEEMNKYLNNNPYGWYLSSSSYKEVIDMSIPIKSD